MKSIVIITELDLPLGILRYNHALTVAAAGVSFVTRHNSDTIISFVPAQLWVWFAATITIDFVDVVVPDSIAVLFANMEVVF